MSEPSLILLMALCMAIRLPACHIEFINYSHYISLTLKLLHAVTKVPSPLQGPETTSEVVCILARELTSRVAAGQNGIIVMLHGIVHRNTVPCTLNPDALDAIYALAWHFLA